MKSNLGNKKTMAQNIRYYMNLRNKTRTQLCDDLGISINIWRFPKGLMLSQK